MSIESLVAAGNMALGEVPSSTLISIETEQNGAVWEVQVVTADGTEYQMDVSADGSEILTDPVAEDDDAADKAKHQSRIAAAALDFEEAAEAMLLAVPDGMVIELNLDDEAGTTVWEGDVIDDSGIKHEVQIDAVEGSVLRNN